MPDFFERTWKAVVGGVGFAVSLVAARVVFSSLGIHPPRLPLQAPESIAVYYLLGGSIVLSASMVPPTTGIGGSRPSRWVVLSTFLGVAFAISTTIETSVFSDAEGSWLMIPVLIPPCLVLSLILVVLLRTPEPNRDTKQGAHQILKGISWEGKLLRAAAAVLAFPVVYFIFGLIASPFVLDYYATGTGGLALPTPFQIVKIEILRGTLHLLAATPVVVLWQKNKRRLVISLAAAFFAFVFTYDIILANQLPLILTLVHGLEVLAGSFVYSWLLVFLLLPNVEALEEA